MLFWVPAPLPAIALVALSVGGSFSAAGWTILLATSVGVGALLMSLIVQPTPLPEGLTPPVSARRSLHRFRQFTGLRIALALATMVIGAAAALVGGGMYPLLAALALALPQLLLAMPSFFTITRARRAMEAWGTTAYLWHALSRPAEVTWPFITPMAKAWHSYQVERSRESMRRKLAERAWDKAVREETENADGAEAANERTDLLRPLTPPTTGTDGPAGAVPHPDADTVRAEPGEDGKSGRAEEPTAVLPHLGEEEPTAVLPHLDEAPDTAFEDTAEKKREGLWPGATVNRAARQIIERGSGALSLAVRRARRGRSSTRPHPHKP